MDDSKKKFRKLVESIYPDQFSVFLKRLKDKQEGKTISTIVKEVFEQYPLVQGMLFELSGKKENEEEYYKGWRLLMMEQISEGYLIIPGIQGGEDEKEKDTTRKKFNLELKPVEFAEKNEKELKDLEKANSGNMA